MPKDLPNNAAQLLKKVRQWLKIVDRWLYEMPYTSTPVWKPWRDY